MGFTGDPVWLEDVLREALGDRLVVEGDWGSRGTGAIMGDIWGVMIHHTGNINETVAHIRDGVWQGDPPKFLPGPLAQCLLTPDGKCHLIAVGPCNHAGLGSYPGLGSNNGNRRLIAFECCWPTPRPDLPKPHYDPNERWSTPLVITMRDATAAVLKKLGYGSSRAIGHKEYAPGRKPDPGNMDMNWFRGEVQKDLDGVVFPGEQPEPLPGPFAVGEPVLPAPVNVGITEAVMAIRRWPGVDTGPLGDRMAKFLENYPKAEEIYITSGRDGDHGQSSHHYGLSYNGSPTAALDIGAGGQGPGSVRMRDFAKWLYDNYAAFTVELIHSTPFADDDGFYVKNQVKYPGGGPYGGPGAIGHFDHVHWATSSDLLSRLEQRSGESAPARVRADVVTADVPHGVANTAPVWGWDASDYDWDRGPMNLVAAERDGISFFAYKATEGSDWRTQHYQEALERARAAGIPVLGTYHFLWPNNIEAQVNFWMETVEARTPWWKDVPWIWQIDAEKSRRAPRTANPAEILQTVNLVKRRLAERGNNGYVIAYTPKWLYGDTLTDGYDIWASNYNGSGAARPFKEQYQGVTDFQAGWKPMAGRKPRILQFASDGQVGTQHTCCVDKFDGDLYELIRLCGREPQPIGPSAFDVQAADTAYAGNVAAPDVPVSGNGFDGARQPIGYRNGAAPADLTAQEQRELLELLRRHAGERVDESNALGCIAGPDDATAAPVMAGGDGDLSFSLLERRALTYGDRQAIAMLKQMAAAAVYPERQQDAKRAASILAMVSTRVGNLN